MFEKTTRLSARPAKCFYVRERGVVLEQDHFELLVQQAHAARDLEIAALVAHLGRKSERTRALAR